MSRSRAVLAVFWSVTLLADPLPKSASKPERPIRLAVRIGVGRETTPQFAAAIDGNQTRIARVLTPADGQILLLVLDLAGDLGLIEPAEQALSAALRNLPKQTYVGVLRAQDGLRVLVDPTADRDTVIAAVAGLTISGRPGLLDTVMDVERLADSIGKKSNVRMSVLYVTDSDVRDYREDFTNPVVNSSDAHDLSRKFPESLIQEKIAKLQNLFEAHETPVHIVHISYRGDRLNEAYQNGLKQLTEILAGSTALCRSQAEIAEAITGTLNEISSEYALIVNVPETSRGVLNFEVKAGDLPVAYRARLALRGKRQ